jgi:hypothetical protein
MGITRTEEATLDRSGIGKGNFYVKLGRINSAWEDKLCLLGE